MSAGQFIITRYVSDNGNIYKIRIQPETVNDWNEEPTGAFDRALGSVRVGGGVRQLGIRARQAVLRWDGTPPAGYAPGAFLRVPVLSPASFAALQEGSVVEYLGTDAVVTSLREEVVN